MLNIEPIKIRLAAEQADPPMCPTWTNPEVSKLVAEVERLRYALRHLMGTCYGAPTSVWDVALAHLAAQDK